jgi:hypothetical protein
MRAASFQPEVWKRLETKFIGLNTDGEILSSDIAFNDNGTHQVSPGENGGFIPNSIARA